jgi:hypothetical protein
VATDMSKYDNAVNTIIPGLQSQINSIDESIKQIRTDLQEVKLNADSILKLNSLFENTVIL